MVVNLRIRRYRHADRTACLSLFDAHVPRYFRAEERGDFASFLDAPPGPFYVVDDGAGAALACGGVAIEDDGRTGSLCWGIVHAGHQGAGLGSRLLLERLAVLAATPGCEVVRLDTVGATAGFFECLGFRTVRVEIDGYAAGIDRHELRLELSADVRASIDRRLDRVREGQ